MSRKLDLEPGQASLCTGGADDAAGGESAAVVFGVVGHVELLVWVGLEALQAVPGRVLEDYEETVGGEEEVEVTGADERVVGVLDHALEDAVLRRAERGVADRLVITRAAEDVGGGALLPVGNVRRIDRILDVSAVEVHNFARRDVIAWVHASKDTPQMRAGVRGVVDVKAGVRLESGGVDVIEKVTHWNLACKWVGKHRECTLWRREC